MQNLPKHEKYKAAYQPGDTFWGIGIEHEVYLESTAKKADWKLDDALTKTKPERYSVRYIDAYQDGVYEKGIRAWFAKEDTKVISVPILMNSHTFQKTDVELEHATTYSKNPGPNPKFDGSLVIDRLRSVSDYFRSEYEKAYLFDGDTVEFATLDYYKAHVEDVLEELDAMEKRFVGELNLGLEKLSGRLWNEYGPFRIMSSNYPFACYLTNLTNLGLFNNGTIHLNLTLPTKLNERGEIADRVRFLREHQLYARLIQWMEPFWISMYGSADPFAGIISGAPFGSQRGTVMRYIGVGTYNTKAMNYGKILQVDASGERCDVYRGVNSDTCYVGLKKIGLDINYQKHYNHGLELRFLDHMNKVGLRNILTVCIYLMDHLLEEGGEGGKGNGEKGKKGIVDSIQKVRDPHDSRTWKGILKKGLLEGHKATISPQDQISFGKVFGCTVFKTPKTFREFYAHICESLAGRYSRGACASRMLYGPRKAKEGSGSDEGKEPYVEVRVAETVNEPEGKLKAPWYCCWA